MRNLVLNSVPALFILLTPNVPEFSTPFITKFIRALALINPFTGKHIRQNRTHPLVFSRVDLGCASASRECPLLYVPLL